MAEPTSGAVWFHGTTKSASDIIVQEGFQAGTYFARHLEDALHMGGEYIFEVWFGADPSADWQWVTPEPVSADQIMSVYRLEPTVIFDSQECRLRVATQLLREKYGRGSVGVCAPCQGRGQEEYYKPFVRWRGAGDELPATACKVCKGHGAVTTDGSDILDHLCQQKGLT